MSSPSRGVLLTVAYDGRAFAGFARQASQRTVAGELDRAIRAVDPAATEVRCASRTDAGVHARDQKVAFDTATEIKSRGWVLALLDHLPRDIGVRRAAFTAPGYQPRHRARRKTYHYVVVASQTHDPLHEQRAWRVRYSLDLDAMRSALHVLIGTHDFRAFRSAQDMRQDTERTLLRAELCAMADEPEGLRFEIEGDRFMHRMIRIIVGTVIDVGRGRLPPDVMTQALEQGERELLGQTAPPDGLYLQRVELDDEGRDPWPPLTRG